MAEDGIGIFSKEIKFIAGAAAKWQIPELFLPQVAFMGKSNVGKSSLINAVCKRKMLARVSHTPGRTRQINFFTIAEKLILADLPGYGFAKIALTEKAKWEALIVHYLKHSSNLRLINLLIDARRGIKDHDLKTMELLKFFNKAFQIILTKIDKINFSDNFLAEIRHSFNNIGYSGNIIAVSTRNNTGIKELKYSLVQSLK